MNDYFGSIIQKKPQPMVDFNCNNQRVRNPRKSMFQMLSPRKGRKNALDNNPKDIFNANNALNLILSKNLKTIYDENKSDISRDAPIYENVNYLINNNKKSNQNNYKKFLISKKMSYNLPNNYYNNLKTHITKKNFQHSAIINSKSKLMDFAGRNSIKKTIDFGKKSNFLQFPHKKEKEKDKDRGYGSSIINEDSGKKKPILANDKKRYSSPSNKYKFNLKHPNIAFSRINKGNNNKEGQRDSNPNIIKVIPCGKKSRKSFFSKDMKKTFLALKNKNLNLNKRRSSTNSNFKMSIKVKDRCNTRNSLFEQSPEKNLKIPTLKQINNAINKTFIGSKIGQIQSELNNLENNEVTQIINNLPQNNIEKTNQSRLPKKSLSQILDISVLNNSKQKELNPLNSRIEYLALIPDDKLQKKYRKLYLSRNLYDSLDDEEVADEEKIYRFYISPNSLTVYILDFFVLISSFIEVYYLPIYISLHITSFAVYSKALSSFLFYVIDFIYIIDLITGFFRAYYNFEEVLIKRNVNICINYLTGWFILDLIEAIPFFTLLDKNMKKSIKAVSISSNYYGSDFGLNNNYFALTVLKAFKIFKTFSFNRLFKEIYKHLDHFLFFYEWKGLLFSILVVFSSLHLCTCFFIFIGRNEFQGWILQNNLQDKTFGDLYVASLYYQMTTLTTVGYGDISANVGLEKIYGIFILIVGTCAYSWILTYISNYIKKNNEKFIDFEEKMKVLTEIKMEYPNLSNVLYDRIKRYLNYNKSEYNNNIKFILESLPSSLQNNLIIEIYKPIIKNFQFFKSFENSDFFVKIVTSLKPILSMKDDILIQEGDIIEDIIFIKKGVLTLEIIVNLSDQKRSLLSHLEMTGMSCFKSISNKKFTELINNNSLAGIYKSDFGKPILYNDKYEKKKEIKIIDLRRNEHFGDILMILNEKSPVAVKVKSKKAELFFLQKTEATEISNRYSNIWKRIVNRSLHNMKQIKNLIRKKVFLYIESNNIKMDDDFNEKYLSKENTNVNNTFNPKEKIKKNNSSNNIDTIIEEESNIDKSNMATSNRKKDQSSSSQTKVIQIPIPDINESKIKTESIAKLSSKKKIKRVFFKSDIINEKEDKIKSEIHQRSDINGVNDVINLLDKEVMKSSKINNKSSLINNFNINIYTPKVQFPLNQINIENQSSNIYEIKKEKSIKENVKEINNDSSMSNKVNNEISFNKDFIMNIKDNEISMNNSDENNNIFLSNIKLKDNINTNISDNYSSNIIKLLDIKKLDKKPKPEKNEIKTNDNISIKSESSDKSKFSSSNKNSDDIPKIKMNKFSNLDTSQSSFSIKSIYENFNQISQYKLEKSPDLREKTKKFILEQIEEDKEENKARQNQSKTNKNTNKFLSIKFNMNLNVSKKNLSRLSENYETSNISSKNIVHKTGVSKRATLQFDESKFEDKMSPRKSSRKADEYIIKSSRNEKDESPKKSAKRFISVINKKNSIKKKSGRKHVSNREPEKTFYNQIKRKKTLKKRRTVEEKSEIELKDNNNMNYDKLISKNIEDNQQNLNNPEEYFQGFFKDIISKKKQGNNTRSEEKLKRRSTVEY